MAGQKNAEEKEVVCLTKIYGQKISKTEYIYKSHDGKNICRISVLESGSMQNVEIDGLGFKLASDFDIETTLVPKIKRSIFDADKKVGHLEYLQNKKLNLMCLDVAFDIHILPISYVFYKDGIQVAVIHRFWRKDIPRYENSEPKGFKIETIEELTDEQLLLILAMPILRFDFGIDEFDCIM